MMTLGDRMKEYERKSEKEGCLDPHAPVVIRLDGCAFHTWVKRAGCVKPFDQRMIDAMQVTANELCKSIQSAVMAYVQSDEITVVLRNDQSENSDPWFGNRIQKLCSISASMAGCFFNKYARQLFGEDCPDAFFDSRVMFMPSRDEVFNCILWRQNDCIRNSVSGLAQAHFSPKQLDKKNTDEKKAMLLGNGVDWNALETYKKYGAVIHRKNVDGEYNGTVFTRKVFFIDGEFGKVDFDRLGMAYDF